VKAASRLFRRRGIAATGLASVMKGAGLTVGTFYTHFASKQALVAAAIDDAAEERLTVFRPVEQGGKGLKSSLQSYLSTAHCDKPDTGCLTVAYGSEIVRQSGSTRKTFTATVEQLLATIAEQLPDQANAKRRQQACVIYAMMVGAVQSSRAVDNRNLANEMLASSLDAALQFLRTPDRSEAER
jgi:TetR/AcrR family transcriptional repressor of nem operon